MKAGSPPSPVLSLLWVHPWGNKRPLGAADVPQLLSLAQGSNGDVVVSSGLWQKKRVVRTGSKEVRSSSTSAWEVGVRGELQEPSGAG